MEEQNIVVDEFENERYAEIVKRDLELAGIKANIIKNDNEVFIYFSDENDGAKMVIPGTHVKKAKEILEIKFI